MIALIHSSTPIFGRYKIKHRSQVDVLPIQKESPTLVKANLIGLIRPKQKFLGIRLAFTSVWDTFCIDKTF